MTAKKLKTVLSKRYDLSGNTLLRQATHWFRCKTSIMGNYSQGAGIKNLLTLWILHYLGAPLFRFRIWLKNQYKLKSHVRVLISHGRSKQ